MAGSLGSLEVPIGPKQANGAEATSKIEDVWTGA